MKKILFYLTPLLINLVASYGESYGKIVGGIYLDIELIAASIFFVIFFAAILFSIRKMNLLKNDTIRIVFSIIISIFAIFGLNKLGFDYTKIIIDLGIQNFLLNNLIWIIIIALIISSIFFGFSKVIMICGGIFFILGLVGLFDPELVYNAELILIIGLGLFGIGYLLNKKLTARRKNLHLSPKNRRKINKLQKELNKANRKKDYKKANLIMEQIKFIKTHSNF